MNNTKDFVLLSLGLCLLLTYVSAKNKNPYGEVWFKPKEEISALNQLEQLQRQQGQLVKKLAKPLSVNKKQELNWELQDIRASIATIESNLNKKLVKQEEKLKTIAGLREEFAMEKEQLKKELNEAENKRLKAITELQFRPMKSSEVAKLRSRIHILSEERDKIAKEYEEYIEALNQQEVILDEERDNIINEKGKLHETLNAAKKTAGESSNYMSFRLFS